MPPAPAASSPSVAALAETVVTAGTIRVADAAGRTGEVNLNSNGVLVTSGISKGPAPAASTSTVAPFASVAARVPAPSSCRAWTPPKSRRATRPSTPMRQRHRGPKSRQFFRCHRQPDETRHRHPLTLRLETYTGGTNVNEGGVSFLKTAAKPATGTVTAVSGTLVGLGVGAAPDFFTSADVDALFAGTLAGVSNPAPSEVGIDTSAGNFTHPTSISSTTRGLVKLGANTLTLSGTNTYTGPTTVAAGSLQIDNPPPPIRCQRHCLAGSQRRAGPRQQYHCGQRPIGHHRRRRCRWLLWRALRRRHQHRHQRMAGRCDHRRIHRHPHRLARRHPPHFRRYQRNQFRLGSHRPQR